MIFNPLKYYKYKKMYKTIKNSELFDEKYYLFTYPDVRKADIDPIKHYIKHGADEGRNPNKYFDTKFYLKHYQDVKSSGINPLFHYIKYGVKEGRNPNSSFDTKYYLDKYQDVRENGINPLLHYIKHGEKAGRIQNKSLEEKFLLDIKREELILTTIKNSELFDEKYYLFTYSDIRKADIDPIKHYIKHGADEGRNPNKYFDTKFYLKHYQDVKSSGINPLFHYIKYGVKEGRNPNSSFDTKYYLDKYQDVRENGINPLLHYIKHGEKASRIQNKSLEEKFLLDIKRKSIILKQREEIELTGITADIILPVYNALEDVQMCINSLYDHKTFEFNLIVIDDFSQIETQKYLEEQSEKRKFKLLRNSENMRFTKTVNRGFENSSADYVVLLNSDTIVTPMWIEKILRCFKSDDKIGIVGPLSNAASWQSVPVRDDEEYGGWMVNLIPDGYSVAEMGKLIETISYKQYPEVPSVNGFCYVIKREVLNKNGVLDVEYFPTGYGEEDDFSIRAKDAGFKIAVADDTYIFHSKSKSYTHEIREVLTKGGRKSLDKKHGKERIKKLISDWKGEPNLPEIAKHINSYMQVANKNKKIVYTAIFGNYDEIKEPEYINDDWDYVCFTDNRNLTSKTFTIKYVNAIFENKTKNARMIKILSHLFLIGYKHSLWIDGNVKLRGRNINELVDKYKDDYIALHQHEKRQCIYSEAIACIQAAKDNQDIINIQIQEYKTQKMPENIGLVETAEILRNQKHPKVKLLNEKWWDELNRFSIRDQLSFNYICWKNDLNYRIMGGIQWIDPYFNIYKHGIQQKKIFKKSSIALIIVIREKNSDFIYNNITNIIKMTDYINFTINLAYISNDKNTKKTIKELEFKYENINILEFESVTPLVSIKNEISKSLSEEFICFLDENIEIIESNWLSLMMQEILQNDCVQIVGPAILDSNYKLKSMSIKIKNDGKRFIEAYSNKKLVGNSNVYALDDSCLLVNRVAFLDIGMFSDEYSSYVSTINLCLNALEKGYYSRFVLNAQVIDHTNDISIQEKLMDSHSLQKKYQNSSIFEKNIQKPDCTHELKKSLLIEPTSVSVIGTCRVYEPFKSLEGKKYFKLYTDEYKHTTKEIIQLLESTHGDFKPDFNLMQLVSKSGLVSNNFDLFKSKITVIEISSLRLIKLGDIYIRSTLLRDFLKDKIVNFDLWWKDLLHSRLKDSKDKKYAMNFSSLDKKTQYIIENVECIQQSKNDFINDIEKIVSFFDTNKRIILVSHFDMLIKGSYTERVPERVKIVNWLSEFANEKNLEFYNPRHKLEEFGTTDGLLDNSHYTKEFESVMENEFLNILQQNKKIL